MSTQQKRQERAMELIGFIGRPGYTAEKALAEFTTDEIADAKTVVAEGGYWAPHFALGALQICRRLQSGITWFDTASSRPAHNTCVWISYLYDGKPTLEEAYLNADGWFIRGTRKIPVKPYAWLPKQAIQPAPVRS